MTTNIFKAIGVGILAGALLFFIPFPFRFFFIFFLIFFAFRFFTFGRFRRRGHWNDENNNRYHFWNPSYTQRWRNMNNEERKSFIQKMESELFSTNISTEK